MLCKDVALFNPKPWGRKTSKAIPRKTRAYLSLEDAQALRSHFLREVRLMRGHVKVENDLPTGQPLGVALQQALASKQ